MSAKSKKKIQTRASTEHSSQYNTPAQGKGKSGQVKMTDAELLRLITRNTNITMEQLRKLYAEQQSGHTDKDDNDEDQSSEEEAYGNVDTHEAYQNDNLDEELDDERASVEPPDDTDDEVSDSPTNRAQHGPRSRQSVKRKKAPTEDSDDQGGRGPKRNKIALPLKPNPQTLKRKLDTSYSSILARVLDNLNLTFHMILLVHNPFMTLQEAQTALSHSLKRQLKTGDAGEKNRVARLTDTADVYKHIYEGAPAFRNHVVDVARRVVSRIYINPKEAEVGAKERAKYVKRRLLKRHGFIHSNPEDLTEGMFENDAIYCVIKEAFFTSPRPAFNVGRNVKVQKELDPIPRVLIAFVCTTIHCALDEWTTAKKSDSKFSSEHYQPIYKAMFEKLKRFLDDGYTTEAYMEICAAWYLNAKNATGAYSDSDSDSDSGQDNLIALNRAALCAKAYLGGADNDNPASDTNGSP